jgi:hypothetical protein
MPYVAEQDVTAPRVIATGRDVDGNEFYETESVPYPEGAVIDDDQLTPELRERLEDGDDERLSSLFRHVSESEADRLREEQAAGTAVPPEHEAEAEALAQDGRDVMTREEVVELNPNGDPPVVEEEAPDLSEGREAKGEEGDIRVHEVDEARRGDAPAPKPKEAPKEGRRRRSRKAESDDEGSSEGESAQSPKPPRGAVAQQEGAQQ